MHIPEADPLACDILIDLREHGQVTITEHGVLGADSPCWDENSKFVVYRVGIRRPGNYKHLILAIIQTHGMKLHFFDSAGTTDVRDKVCHMTRVTINGWLHEKYKITLDKTDVFTSLKCVQDRPDCELMCMYMTFLLCGGSRYEDSLNQIHKEYDMRVLRQRARLMQASFDEVIS